MRASSIEECEEIEKERFGTMDRATLTREIALLKRLERTRVLASRLAPKGADRQSANARRRLKREALSASWRTLWAEEVLFENFKDVWA